jgi:hypothetical protein
VLFGDVQVARAVEGDCGGPEQPGIASCHTIWSSFRGVTGQDLHVGLRREFQNAVAKLA